MFREITREVKEAERLTDERRKELGYKKIKPQTEMTIEEIEQFWMNEIQKARAEN